MFVNIDINTVVHPFLRRVGDKKHFCKEMLYPFVDQYADTRVTDLLFNIFCQYSATDSRVWGTYEDKYLQTEENGEPVDHKQFFDCLYKMNKELSADPFEVWIDRCKKVGIRPWLSFRMNDAHNNGDAPYFARTDFFYQAKARGWTLGSDYGYYGGNFDYSVKEIRDRMLAYIEEQLDRYNVDGIELDFLREIICFRYHTADMSECIGIMNSFVSQVKEIIKKAEAKKGHEILLAVRVMRDYEQSLRYGFDPTAWDVDILVPSPRWASSDSGIAVEEWKRLCPDSKILPCIETLFAVESDHSGIMSAEVVRGHAASFMARGADDVYLYNFFSDPDAPYDIASSPKGHPYHRNVSLYRDVERYPKRFAIVGQSSEHYPDSFPTWRPFPTNEGDLKIVTGDIPEDREAVLVVGVEGDINEVTFTFNTETCHGFTETELTYISGIGAQPEGYVGADTLCYACPVTVKGRVQSISFSGSVMVTHAELVVI